MKRFTLQQITLIILGVFAVTSISLSIFQLQRKSNIVVVDLAKLYSEFEMKKQLEIQMDQVSQLRKKRLDSLELYLNMSYRNLQNSNLAENSPEFVTNKNLLEAKQQEFLYAQKQNEQDDAAMSDQYNNQIWKQLNEYVKEYGRDNNVECIIGGDGTGNVMYSDSGLDVTEDLIVYCNTKYNGR